MTTETVIIDEGTYTVETPTSDEQEKALRFCRCCDIHIDPTTATDNTKRCIYCYNNCGYCNACDTNAHNLRYCRDCDFYSCCCDCETEEERHKAYEIELKFSKNKSETYQLNRSRRFCGVEIETTNDNLSEYEFNNYMELLPFGFSQVQDGSIEGSGAEYVSLAFNGDLLFNKINTMCNELKKRHFKVNASCGLHIHIEVKNYDLPNKIKKILAFYEKYEDYFYRMVSPSRQNNNFCRRINDIYKHVLNARPYFNNLKAYKKCFYQASTQKRALHYQKDKYNGLRYCWLNLHSLFYHGTLEVRLHNGTIEQDKITKWLALHLRCIDLIEGNTLETLAQLPKTEEMFLSFFKPEIRDYILRRWRKFNKTKENADGLRELN